MPPTAQTSRRGSARLPLALAGLALLALLGLVLWSQGERPDPNAPVRGAAARSLDGGPDAPMQAAGPTDLLATSEGAGTRGSAAPRGVRLAGQGKLAGRVVQWDDGRGVGGVRVDLMAVPPAAAEFAANLLRLGRASAELSQRLLPIASTTSGGDGSFAFEGVREGVFFLEARGPKHVPMGAQRVRVAPSGDGGPVEVLVRPGGAVAGRVQLPDGRAARGRVALYQGAKSFLDAARRADLVRLETDLDGRGEFWIAGVPPGTGYDLTVVGEGTVLSHSLGIEVRAGETTRVEWVARLGATVTGQVLGRDPAGGEGLVPVAGALVGPVPRGLRDLGFVESMLRAIGTRAGPDGSYRIEGVPPGEFDVAAIGEFHLPGHVGALRAVEGGVVSAPELVLETGPIARGRVVDGAGQPVSGVDVRWDLADIDPRQLDFTFTPLLYQAQRYFEYPRTGADGSFRAGPLPGDAPHTIAFWAPGYAWKRARFDPKDAGEFLVVLERGGAVEGIAMDVGAGLPLTAFTIDTPDRIDQEGGEPGAFNPFAGAQLFEGNQGRFRLDAVRAGSRQLTVRAPGYVTQVVSVEVVEGETTRGLVVEMERGATVRGRVVDGAGAGVAGAQVVALDPSGRLASVDRARTDRGPVPFGPEADGFLRIAPTEIVAGIGLLSGGSVSSDREGRFELSGLPQGAARLLGVHRDFAPTETEPLALDPKQPIEDFELVLSRGGGVAGRVTDRHGRGVPDAIVLATTPPSRDGSRLYQGATDQDGNYTIAPMAGGSYFLLVTRADSDLSLAGFLGSLQFDLVSVPKDEILRMDLVDRSAAATVVFGVVRDRGQPQAGGVITAANFESDNVLGVDFKVAPVGRDGTYRFPGLAPGDYQFTYQSPRSGEVRVSAEVPDRAEWQFDVELPQGALRGQVVEQGSKQPIANASVSLRPLGGRVGGGLLATFLGGEARQRSARTDGSGAYSFAGLEAGEYQLVVAGPQWGEGRGQYAPAPAQKLRLLEGESLDLEPVELAPSLVIQGWVRSKDGEPVQNARLSAIARDGGLRAAATSRSEGDGRFELRGLAPGRYDVVATASGFAEGRASDVAVEVGTNAEVELVLGTGARLSVRVYGADGRPAAGAVGRLVREGGATGEEAARAQASLEGILEGRGVANTLGIIDFGAVAPGRWVVRVARASLAGESDVFELSEGDQLEVRVDLR